MAEDSIRPADMARGAGILRCPRTHTRTYALHRDLGGLHVIPPSWRERRGKEESVTDDERHGEFRVRTRSREADEQGDARPDGVGGAKGRARGESGKPKHAPDTGPGKRVTGGRVDALRQARTRRKINWVVDIDIRAFFDTVSREWLVRFLEHRIGDKRVIRLIIKWLRAGVMEAGEWRDDLRGTPQGSVASPILANIYLHYVLDLWFQKKWRSREAKGDAIIVRYADDFVVGFQHKRDAERFLDAVKERFRNFGLEIHPDKTRLIEFGRSAMEDRRKQGFGRPETFDFLGFTHYCTKTREQGKFQLGRKPVAKRMVRTLKRIKEALRRRMHESVKDTAQWLGKGVDGWLGYFAVPTAFRYLERFVVRLKRMWLLVLRRRSQKDHSTWADIARLTAQHWPRLEIRHPWPERQFAVRAGVGATQGRSRMP